MSSPATKACWKLAEFVAHGSAVNCLALSPSNGRTLVTGGDDRRLNLWVVGQPNSIMSITGMTSAVESVTFNNSENWIAAGTKSGVIKVFDLDENKTVRTFSGHKAAVSSMDFHRYGDVLATGSLDTNLKLWDIRRKGTIYNYKGHTEVINAVQFSPDGKWVVTGSSDHTVKVWDLSAGRLLADFTSHSAAVVSVRFHPAELLLASGGSDRCLKFWDMEKFEFVFETPPESSGVRSLCFHPEGKALFSGTQDSLKLYGSADPAPQLYDAVQIHWGKLASLAVSGEQLIGAAYRSTNVSVWCVDLTRLCPFSGAKPPVSLSASGRRQFEYQQQEHVVATPTATQHEQPSSSSGGDSPPTELKPEERMELFEARQKLVRTPPKKFAPPFPAPSESPPRQPVFSVKPHPPRAELTSVPVSRHIDQPRPPQQPRPPEPAAGRSVLQEFANPPTPAGGVVMNSQSSSDHRTLSNITTNHADVSDILKSRLSALKKVRAAWSPSEPKCSLELAVNTGNQAVLVDLLNVLNLKRTLWSLDMVLVVLPELGLLLKSKYPSYVRCSCSCLKLVLKSFGPVIKTNVSVPPQQGGVDLIREERYEKCQTCHAHLLALREEAWQLAKTTPTSAATKVVSEQALLQAFSVLE